MTCEERERETIPPGVDPVHDTEPAMLTERGFRRIMREVVSEVVGDKLIDLDQRVRKQETRITSLENAVTRALAVRQVTPFVLALFAVASSLTALVVVAVR